MLARRDYCRAAGGHGVHSTAIVLDLDLVSLGSHRRLRSVRALWRCSVPCARRPAPRRHDRSVALPMESPVRLVLSLLLPRNASPPGLLKQELTNSPTDEVAYPSLNPQSPTTGTDPRAAGRESRGATRRVRRVGGVGAGRRGVRNGARRTGPGRLRSGEEQGRGAPGDCRVPPPRRQRTRRSGTPRAARDGKALMKRLKTSLEYE
jgi:hypothetical protein